MSNVNDQCPICGAGSLHQQVEVEHIEYKGQILDVPLYYAECDACGSEQAGADHLKRNKRTLIALKKAADGLLTGAEVRALRERLGLTQAQAAKVFGGGPVAFSKYESDDVAQSDAMDKLLRLADAMPDVLVRLVSEAGVTPMEQAHRIEWQTLKAYGASSFVGGIITKRPQLRLVHTSVAESSRKYG